MINAFTLSNSWGHLFHTGACPKIGSFRTLALNEAVWSDVQGFAVDIKCKVSGGCSKPVLRFGRFFLRTGATMERFGRWHCGHFHVWDGIGALSQGGVYMMFVCVCVFVQCSGESYWNWHIASLELLYDFLNYSALSLPQYNIWWSFWESSLIRNNKEQRHQNSSWYLWCDK